MTAASSVLPVSPSSSSTSPDATFDSRVYMTPESPEKAFKPVEDSQQEQKILTRYSLDDVMSLIKSVQAKKDIRGRLLIPVILHLHETEGAKANDTRILLLCEQLAECICVHVYSVKSESLGLDNPRLFPRCLACPIVRDRITADREDVCIEQMAYALLPNNLALLVADFKHAVAVSQLLYFSRSEGYLPLKAILQIVAGPLPRAGVWIFHQIENEVDVEQNESQYSRRKRPKSRSK